MKFIIHIVLILTYNLLIVSHEPENNTITATNEWQEVQEDQEIPAGVYVRINLTTGLKEIKLLDKEENEADEEEESFTTLREDEYNEEDRDYTGVHIRKDLENALKEVHKGARSGLDYSTETQTPFKLQFESNKAYKNMRQNFNTDTKIITQLLYEYQNIKKDDSESKRVQSHLRILENLHYMLEQIDNALWFIDAGGLDYMLLPLVVNETNVLLRAKAMRVLGVVVEKNPKAQIKVYERNFGSHLAQVLRKSVNSEELSKALYAFAALLQRFPLAQKRILSTSGTQALVEVLGKKCEMKIKAKAASLLRDLIVEKQIVDSDDVTAIMQYSEVHLFEWLLANSYCETMEALLTHDSLIEFLAQPELFDNILLALSSTQEICFDVWTESSQLRHILLTLKSHYGESEDEHRQQLAEHLRMLSLNLFPNAMTHDEL